LKGSESEDAKHCDRMSQVETNVPDASPVGSSCSSQGQVKASCGFSRQSASNLRRDLARGYTQSNVVLGPDDRKNMEKQLEEYKASLKRPLKTKLDKMQTTMSQVKQVVANVEKTVNNVHIVAQSIESKMDSLPEDTTSALLSGLASTANEPGLDEQQQIALDRERVRFLNSRINRNKEIIEDRKFQEKLDIMAPSKKAELAARMQSVYEKKIQFEEEKLKQQEEQAKKKQEQAKQKEEQAAKKKEDQAKLKENQAKRKEAPAEAVQAEAVQAEVAEAESVHAEAERHLCPVCGKDFPTHRGLQTHRTKSKHRDEDPVAAPHKRQRLQTQSEPASGLDADTSATGS